MSRTRGGSRRRGWLVFGLALLPALAALWSNPWFVTQDGPAHLYNAQILARSFDPQSPFRPYYLVRWEPLPNWAGHALTAALISVLPPEAAERVVVTLTLVGFAATVLWLRVQVAGTAGMPLAALLAALLGLNIAWLFGFTSFLLGACLFPVTLGVWWAGREQLSWGRVAVLALLLTLGYFCHLVSLGLTVVGLGVLALTTPGPGWRARWVRTAAALVPLIPLGILYLSLSRRGGKMEPLWGPVRHPFSVRAWVEQLVWVDPLSLAAKTVVPFSGKEIRGFALLAPIVWLGGALAVLTVATVLGLARGTVERRGWAWLAALLLIAGVIGPDTLGPNHGQYLPQRVLLLGLAALLPVLDLEATGFPKRWPARLAGAMVLLALLIQSAIVWDYARDARRTSGAFARARDRVGRNQRVATLLIDIRGRFRANPLMHADNLLGLDTGNIVWNNYETRFYYFPVQFRPELEHPSAEDLEEIALFDRDPTARAGAWEHLLRAHLGSIDVLVVWGADPLLDAINARWFKTVDQVGDLRILRPRAGVFERGFYFISRFQFRTGRTLSGPP